LIGICDSVAGLFGGLLTGWLVRWQMLKASANAQATSIRAISSALLITGCFLGWQACGMLAVVTLPLLAGCWFWDRSRPEPRFQRVSAPLFFAMLFGFLLFWKQLDEAVWMIGHAGWSFTPMSWSLDWALSLVLLFVFASVVRFCVSKETRSIGFQPVKTKT